MAASSGGDTDSIASIAGSLFGAALWPLLDPGELAGRPGGQGRELRTQHVASQSFPPPFAARAMVNLYH